MLWLGCAGSPATNRSLPSLSAFHAVTGLVLGMTDIVPRGRARSGIDARAARPAVAAAGGHAVADPGQRVHAAADAGGQGGADLAGLGGALAHPVGDGSGQPRRRAARVGQARLPAPRQAAARMRDGDRHRPTATWCPTMSKRCFRCPVSAPTPQGPSHVSHTASGCPSSTPTFAASWPGQCTAAPMRPRRRSATSTTSRRYCPMMRTHRDSRWR